jgi:hypothetical protein
MLAIHFRFAQPPVGQGLGAAIHAAMLTDGKNPYWGTLAYVGYRKYRAVLAVPGGRLAVINADQAVLR